MNPFSHTGLSISDSLKSVRKSVLIYETIILRWIIFINPPYVMSNNQEREKGNINKNSVSMTEIQKLMTKEKRGIIRMCEQVAAFGNTLILYSA